VSDSLRFLIVNADDFGYSRGINRGIAQAHAHGIVTSTTLIVNAPAARDALELARRLPGLAVGLHVNFTNEADRLVEFDDLAVCRCELRRQFDRFVELAGRPPSHLDSHQHVHRDPDRLPVFQELAREQGLHLRDMPPVVSRGGFYAQWEHMVTDATKVSVEMLARMLREEVPRGVTEFICHPGYFDAGLTAVYHKERELELATLCEPAVRRLVAEQGIELISHAQLPRALARLEEASRPAR